MVITITRKPFHASILDALGRCRSRDSLVALGDLIVDTKIPQGHDAILQAFKRKAIDIGIGNAKLYARVIDSLYEQEREAGIGIEKKHSNFSPVGQLK